MGCQAGWPPARAGRECAQGPIDRAQGLSKQQGQVPNPDCTFAILSLRRLISHSSLRLRPSLERPARRAAERVRLSVMRGVGGRTGNCAGARTGQWATGWTGTSSGSMMAAMKGSWAGRRADRRTAGCLGKQTRRSTKSGRACWITPCALGCIVCCLDVGTWESGPCCPVCCPSRNHPGGGGVDSGPRRGAPAQLLPMSSLSS